MDNSYKIAIIGGTGKVGRHIAARALEKGYQVRMLVRNPEKLTFRDARVEIVEGMHKIWKIFKTTKRLSNSFKYFWSATQEKQIYSSVTKNILEVMTDLQINRYIGVTGGSLTINGDKRAL